MHHTSTFSLVQVDSNYEAGPNQFWVSPGFLKKLVATSNMTTIQLRVVCSAIIRDLNPNTF
jgi:hypothetical protein